MLLLCLKHKKKEKKGKKILDY